MKQDSLSNLLHDLVLSRSNYQQNKLEFPDRPDDLLEGFSRWQRIKKALLFHFENVDLDENRSIWNEIKLSNTILKYDSEFLGQKLFSEIKRILSSRYKEQLDSSNSSTKENRLKNETVGVPSKNYFWNLQKNELMELMLALKESDCISTSERDKLSIKEYCEFFDHVLIDSKKIKETDFKQMTRYFNRYKRNTDGKFLLVRMLQNLLKKKGLKSEIQIVEDN